MSHSNPSGSSRLIIIAIVLIGSIWVCRTISKSNGDEITQPQSTTAPRSTSRPIATPLPSTLQVKYEVTGTTYSADLTYSNKTENTEQDTAVLPWILEFEAEPGQFLYVAAQSKFDGTANISCRVTVNGQVVEAANSRGRFVIASCSGSAGD